LEEEGEAEIVVKGEGVERSAFFLCFAGAPVREEFCCCLFSPLGERVEKEEKEKEEEEEEEVVVVVVVVLGIGRVLCTVT